MSKLFVLALILLSVSYSQQCIPLQPCDDGNDCTVVDICDSQGINCVGQDIGGAIVSDGSPPGNRLWNGMIGNQIQSTFPFTVTAIGCEDPDNNGLFVSHECGIWEYPSGNLLASVIVQAGTASPYVNGWRYEEISPLNLQASIIYTIGCDITGDYFSDSFYTGGIHFSGAPGVTIVLNTFSDADSTFKYPAYDGTYIPGRWAVANILLSDSFPCTDNNDCTVGSTCSANGVCGDFVTDPGVPCSDTNVCTVGNTCGSNGVCGEFVTSPFVPCDDGIFCTKDDYCEIGTGVCGSNSFARKTGGIKKSNRRARRGH